MAESERTAEIESPANDIVAAAARAAAEAGDDGNLGVDDGGAVDETRDVAEVPAEIDEEEETVPEPPRRRRVAELLEGEDSIQELPDTGAQLVAPPFHVESVDAGQPIYQLDLSADEPQGVIVAPEPAGDSGGIASVAVPVDNVDPYGAAVPVHSGAHEAVKGMIVDRERRVMAAERDGIGAYDLAVELDDFVHNLVDALRRVGV